MSSRNNGRLQETGRRTGRWLYYHYMTVAADGMEEVVGRGSSSVRSRCGASGRKLDLSDGIFSSLRSRLSSSPLPCLLISLSLPFRSCPFALPLFFPPLSSPHTSGPILPLPTSPLSPRFPPVSPLPSLPSRLSPSERATRGVLL